MSSTAISIEHAAEPLSPDLETVGDDYAARFSGETGRFILGRQSEILSQILNKFPRGSLRILFVGGGHGQLTETMCSFGHQVWVHGSRPECRERLERLELLNEQVHFIVKPFSALGELSGQFDLVTAFRLMAHMPNWEAFIAKLCQIAKQQVVVDFAASSSFNILTPIFFGLKQRIEGNTRPYACQNLVDVRQAFHANGYSIMTVDRQFGIPLALHRAVGRRSISEHAENFCRGIGLTKLVGSPVILSAERLTDRPPD
jgi:hypothetical protein